MTIRGTFLPPGWYPGDPGRIRAFLAPFAEAGTRDAVAALAPHAGWRYSGAIAALSAAALDRDAETVAVIGGHLPGTAPALFAEEDAVETPLGTMPIDRELRDALKARISHGEDGDADNTVEVLLPMARYFFPRAAVLWARFPAGPASYEAGKALFEAAAGLGKKVVVLGSTDLTHYGANYGFSPRGSGGAALDWVREVNDATFIEAVVSGDPALILKRAAGDCSACSPGAALGALAFARSAGCGCAALLKYGTSAEAFPGEVPSSFVGYASLVWRRDV